MFQDFLLNSILEMNRGAGLKQPQEIQNTLNVHTGLELDLAKKQGEKLPFLGGTPTLNSNLGSRVSNTKLVLGQTPREGIASTAGPNGLNMSNSMNRRNVKKLTLQPSLSLNTINDHQGKFTSSLLTASNEDLSSAISTPSHSAAGDGLFSLSSPNLPMSYKDSERRTTTDKLIKNIQNLELGVEYHMEIRPDDLVTLKKLGSGQSGTVSKVLHLPTQNTMAKKIVHLETKELVQSQIIRELRILYECDSPFIIGFYGTFLHEGNVVICMEYVDCGSLEHIFKLTGPFPEFMLKHIAYSVLSGLIYLYDSHRIIHRDVKPSNVLMNSKGKIKLCDFGVSRELINSMADTFVGTSTYMSPERIQGGVYSIKGDVWSLGILLYELASGKMAFQDDANKSNPQQHGNSILELLQRIVNEKPPELNTNDGFSSELSNFVSLCLKKEKQRSTPWELMTHPFLTDFIDETDGRVSEKYRGDIKRWAKNVRRVQRGKTQIVSTSEKN